MKYLVKFSSRMVYVQVISFVRKTNNLTNKLSRCVLIMLKIMRKDFVY